MEPHRLLLRISLAVGVRVMKAAWLMVCTMVFGPAAAGFAEECGNAGSPPTYQVQPGDHVDSKSLDASRSFSGVHQLVINACAGELRIRGTDSSAIRIEVTAENVDQPLDTYVHDFTVASGSAKIDIRLPSRYHPAITVYVPAEGHFESEVNLGAGNLLFHADRIRGERELNLGAGRAVVYLNADRDYASLEANVGMGSFHDKRAGGGSAHFVVARSMQGSGGGDLQVNVGAGQIDLEPVQ